MADRISHSQRIIAELHTALDHAVGGEISRNLESLYDFLFVEHLAILVDQDPRHIDNCLTVLTPLLAAWRDIPPGTAEEAARSKDAGFDSAADPVEDQERKNQPSSLFSVSA